MQAEVEKQDKRCEACTELVVLHYTNTAIRHAVFLTLVMYRNWTPVFAFTYCPEGSLSVPVLLITQLPAGMFKLVDFSDIVIVCGIFTT
ncbi:hypothetical protein J6590_081876 [Homalodisca vitripennis]|nr:hypothetical protein J6590_081876 [Homalodisca vitripennis]